MTSTFQFLLCIVIMFFCFLIFKLISSKSLSLKYSLMWLASCIILIVLVLFPQLLIWFSIVVGIVTPINALFTVAIFCLLLVLLSITVIISKQSARIRKLAQSNAILEARVRLLEKKSSDY